MASTYKDILKNSAFFVAGKGIGALASFAAVLVLGYFVPKNIAGTYSYVIALLSIINIATLPGMNNALTRAVSQGYEGSFFSILQKRLSWGSLGSLAALCIGFYFFFTGNTELGITFFVATPFVPITDTFNDCAIYFWQGKKRFDRSSLLFALYYIGLAALSIPVFVYAKKSVLLVGGILLAQSLMGYILYAFTKKHVSGDANPQSEKLGFHLTAMHGFRILANSMDKVIIFSLFGPVMTAVYTFAATPISKVWQIIPIGALSLPEMSERIFDKDTKIFVIKKTLLLFLITIPAGVALVVIAPFLYHIFFPHYLESINLFRILSITIVFTPIMFIKSSLTAFHQVRALYINEVLSPIMKIVAMIIFGILSGPIGLSLGIVLGTLLEFATIFILFIGTAVEVTES
jgi:O-antigen/teichoic acid export membrane protein